MRRRQFLGLVTQIGLGLVAACGGGGGFLPRDLGRDGATTYGGGDGGPDGGGDGGTKPCNPYTVYAGFCNYGYGQYSTYKKYCDLYKAGGPYGPCMSSLRGGGGDGEGAAAEALALFERLTDLRHA